MTYLKAKNRIVRFFLNCCHGDVGKDNEKLREIKMVVIYVIGSKLSGYVLVSVNVIPVSK